MSRKHWHRVSCSRKKKFYHKKRLLLMNTSAPGNWKHARSVWERKYGCGCGWRGRGRRGPCPPPSISQQEARWYAAPTTNNKHGRSPTHPAPSVPTPPTVNCPLPLSPQSFWHFYPKLTTLHLNLVHLQLLSKTSLYPSSFASGRIFQLDTDPETCRCPHTSIKSRLKAGQVQFGEICQFPLKNIQWLSDDTSYFSRQQAEESWASGTEF